MMQILKSFFHSEAAGGVILIITTILALVAVNSPLAACYDAFLQLPVRLSAGALIIDKPLLLWINDGLMAIFFLLAGLEIKREMLEGALSTWRGASLPLFAALGGMIVPALLYYGLAYHQSEILSGWAIPMATDIAFAVGILALLGNRIPSSLKIFLLALAIIDDLGAILVIALFYTESLHLTALYWALGFSLLLILMNRMQVRSLSLFGVVGFCLWVAVLKSGIHATVAGVVLGFLIPHARGQKNSMLHRLEHGIHPWSAFVIVPLFAFANAGLPLNHISMDTVMSPLSLAILVGLWIGKPVGVFIFSWLAVKMGFAKLPNQVRWSQITGIAMLCGIGFTMSIFIMNLAFGSSSAIAETARFGILIASVLSGGLGYFYLSRVYRSTN